MITIQPETEGNTIVVKASGRLTASDYKNILIPKLEEVLAHYDTINGVITLEDSFQGWEIAALRVALPFARKAHRHLRHMAIVGARPLLKGISIVAAPFLIKELRHFDHASFQTAIAWAKAEK